MRDGVGNYAPSAPALTLPVPPLVLVNPEHDALTVAAVLVTALVWAFASRRRNPQPPSL
ncbi:hypothetical protein [Streptomyces sp. 769]|uniref:hypothetical protein n=1 Tax=Streptomyces sp. 769 TaxID=1262452 RepID=UPI00131DCFEE|nr:hypothetical protein [Streptomyces sp. 769]